MEVVDGVLPFPFSAIGGVAMLSHTNRKHGMHASLRERKIFRACDASCLPSIFWGSCPGKLFG